MSTTTGGDSAANQTTVAVSDFEPTRRVIISTHHNRAVYHTGDCTRMDRTDPKNRKTVVVKDAIGFFELEHCPKCRDVKILPEDELEDLVDMMNGAWDQSQ